MLSMQELLRHVLPASGALFAFVLDRNVEPHGKRSLKFGGEEALENLCEFLFDADDKGLDTYFAVASYPEGTGGRTAVQALYARSFWIDVDMGPGKPYATLAEAAAALSRFLTATGLPMPTLVLSGRGFHAYWTADRDMTAAEWVPAARALKQLTVAHGFHCDPTRTADIASILRPPETWNRKDPAELLPVDCHALAPEIPCATLLATLGAPGPAVLSAAAAPAALPQYAEINQAAAAIRAPAEYAPSDVELAAERCASLAMMRDGVPVAEPLWHALLGVIDHCIDGDEIAHEWSAKDPRYSEAITDAKLQQLRARQTGPTTCAVIRERDGSACAGCRETCISPIQLGRGAAAAPPVAPPATTPLPDLPWPFSWNDRSEMVRSTAGRTPGAPPETVVVSRYAVFLSDLLLSEATGELQYVFTHWRPQEGFDTFMMPVREFEGASGMATFSALGPNIHAPAREHFRNYVARERDAIRARKRAGIQYEQMGWKNDETGFVIGETLYSGVGHQERVFSSADVSLKARDLDPRGTLAGWKTAVAPLFAAGFEAQALTVLAGFAAPLMRFANSEEGGAILSLVSAESGTGKTTGLQAALSIWGQPKALMTQANDTKRHLGRVLSLAPHMPRGADEINTKQDPVELSRMVLDFTAGRDRGRLTQSASLKETPQGWQTIMITTSNSSLRDAVTVGNAEAEGFRILELYPPALPEDVREVVGNKLIADLSANAGTAGVEWVRFLVQPGTTAFIRRALPQLIDLYQKKLDGMSKVRFLARLMGCIHLAALLTAHARILEGDTTGALEFMLEQARLATEYGSPEDAASTLGRFLSEHQNDMMVVQRPWTVGAPKNLPIRAPTRDLLIRCEVDGGKIFLMNSVIRRWCIKEAIPMRPFLSKLERVGVLLDRRRKVSLSAGTDRVSAQVWCLAIDGGHPALSGVLREVSTAPASEVAA